MAIFLLIIGLVIYFIFNVIPITKFHYLFAYLGLALALTSGIGMMANENAHFGMEAKTTNKQVTIKPTASVGQLNLLVYKQVGNKGPKVYIYNGKKKHTQVNTKTINKVKTGYTTATLVTQETRYHFKNKFYKLLFGFLGKENQLKQRVNTFEVPNTWKVLSTSQVTKLKKQMIAMQKKQMLMQAQMQNK
ncbi:DUF4811 domain-containing protein [Lactobacillus jensenii]|jgi:hypothetical protein|uniref:DUF4811 domain-containing protein n=1 Tax=Lactobacillus jensenii TaxID=109790 RepID=UPI0028E982BC|nr:DUF4811 domain-containing protein [Lactobacillus jensenii]MDT9619413.1 DUF4811 domain-containing protein [Lactobacillus jensenii]